MDGCSRLPPASATPKGTTTMAANTRPSDTAWPLGMLPRRCPSRMYSAQQMAAPTAQAMPTGSSTNPPAPAPPIGKIRASPATASASQTKSTGRREW